MPDDEDYYRVLGVQRDATADEIKRVYRKLARELHPDVNPDPAAGERFKSVNRAYDVLSDPRQREMYDIDANLKARSQHHSVATQYTATEQQRTGSAGDSKPTYVRVETEPGPLIVWPTITPESLRAMGKHMLDYVIGKRGLVITGAILSLVAILALRSISSSGDTGDGPSNNSLPPLAQDKVSLVCDKGPKIPAQCFNGTLHLVLTGMPLKVHQAYCGAGYTEGWFDNYEVKTDPATGQPLGCPKPDPAHPDSDYKVSFFAHHPGPWTVTWQLFNANHELVMQKSFTVPVAIKPSQVKAK